VRRPTRRRTLTSTAATGMPNASAATARAVYGPTPGSASSLGHRRWDAPGMLLEDRPEPHPAMRPRDGCPETRPRKDHLRSGASASEAGVG
jgi:hypothetical protein